MGRNNYSSCFSDFTDNCTNVLYLVRVKSGRRFIKNDEVREAFSQTEAYSDIFMELATNADAAAAFVNGIIPSMDKAPTPALVKPE